MHVKMPAELAQALVNYLVRQPFNEVAPLIEELRKLELVDEAATKQPETE